MSNVDNDDLRAMEEILKKNPAHVPTMEEIRADSARLRRELLKEGPPLVPARADQPGGLFSRLNPGEMKEIEDRVNAATGGPWTIYAGNTGIRGSSPYAWVGPEVQQDGMPKIIPLVERVNGTMADVRFIAHARTDVEKLINTVNSMSSRIVKRFNETAEARQDAAAARERAERAEQRAAEAERRAEGAEREWRRVGDLINRAVRFNGQGVFTGVEDFTMLIEVIDTVRRLKDG